LEENPASMMKMMRDEMTVLVENVIKILIDEKMLIVADKYAKDHIKADTHETPIFQTNEYNNKLIGYLGQIAFKKFLTKNKNIRTDFPEVNMDGSPDIYDFNIKGFKIDVKTLLWNEYWEDNTHPNWSIDPCHIITLVDLITKFFFLIPQIQLNIDDFFNPSFNWKKKKNIPKDIYWALFLKKSNTGFIDSEVYIIGWCKYQDIIKANEKKQFFRFNPKYHTNIAIPLKELNSNDDFFTLTKT